MVRATSVGLLVSIENGEPVANLLPFEVVEDGEKTRLRAHLARANGQWKNLDGQDVLVVFQGTNTYISPQWHASKAEHGRVVPTWNYAMVQVKGRVAVNADPAWLHAQVSRLTEHHEQSVEQGRAWHVTDAPGDFIQSQIKGIVGLEIEVSAIAGKLKASQNRTPADRAGVVRGLNDQTDSAQFVMAGLVARGKI